MSIVGIGSEYGFVILSDGIAGASKSHRQNSTRTAA